MHDAIADDSILETISPRESVDQGAILLVRGRAQKFRAVYRLVLQGDSRHQRHAA